LNRQGAYRQTVGGGSGTRGASGNGKRFVLRIVNVARVVTPCAGEKLHLYLTRFEKIDPITGQWIRQPIPIGRTVQPLLRSAADRKRLCGITHASADQGKLGLGVVYRCLVETQPAIVVKGHINVLDGVDESQVDRGSVGRIREISGRFRTVAQRKDFGSSEIGIPVVVGKTTGNEPDFPVSQGQVGQGRVVQRVSIGIVTDLGRHTADRHRITVGTDKGEFGQRVGDQRAFQPHTVGIVEGDIDIRMLIKICLIHHTAAFRIKDFGCGIRGRRGAGRDTGRHSKNRETIDAEILELESLVPADGELGMA